jgi:hypothetical protein
MTEIYLDAERIAVAALALGRIRHQIDIAGQAIDLTSAYRARDYAQETLRQVCFAMIDGPVSPDQIKARFLAHEQAERDYSEFTTLAIDAGLAGFEDNDEGVLPVWALICAVPSWWSTDLLKAQTNNLHLLAVAYRSLSFGETGPEGLVKDNIDGLILKQIVDQLLAA